MALQFLDRAIQLPATAAQITQRLSGAHDEWMMTDAERSTLCALLSVQRPRCAIEVGVYRAGSLAILAAHATKVYALDIDPHCATAYRARFPNVEFITGPSQETLPTLIDKIQGAGEPLEFVLIDADHRETGVRRDIENVLRYRPHHPLYLLMHDSFNPGCRAGMKRAAWVSNPHVHLVELDFVLGRFVGREERQSYREMWCGLALAVLLPELRKFPLTIHENESLAFETALRHSAFVWSTLCLLALAACGDGGRGSTTPPAELPAAIGNCNYVDLNQSLSATLSGSDPQGRELTYEIVGSATNGTVTLTNPLTGRFTYTPNPNARGTDSFTFRVNNGQAYSNTATYRLVYTPRILPLGDSITAGLTVGDEPPPAERIGYRKRLEDDLTATGVRVDFVGSQSNGTGAGIADPDHEGHPGWCDDNIPFCSVVGGQTVDGNITGILDNELPDIVLLHIGTNYFNVDASGVNSILDKVGAWGQANHPVNVFLARIIPTVNGSFDVQTFNDNVQSIAGDRPGARMFIVDQQTELRSNDNPNVANATLMADNLHPNQSGYDRMAIRWRDRINATGVLPRCP